MRVSLRQYADVLMRYLTPQWLKTLVMAALLLASIGLQLVNPLIIGRFIDQATAARPERVLIETAALFIGVAALTQVVSVAATWVSEQVGWTATNMLRADLTLHCLRLDMPFHHTHTPGQLIERIDGDITALATFFSQFVIRILGSALLLLGILVVLFREDPRIGLALTAFALTAMLVLNRIRDLAVHDTATERGASAGLYGFIEERLAGIDDIRANGAGSYVMRRFFEASRAFYRAMLRASAMNAAIFTISAAVFGVGWVLALGMGAWLYRSGAVTIGTVYLIFQYTVMLRRPLEQMTSQLRELQRAGAGVVRIERLRAYGTAIPDHGAAALPPGPLVLACDAVSFAYGDERPVLADVSFRLEAGGVLGVLGRTGSGKTTLTRLLLRLYDPTAGAIRLGGVDVRDVPLAELRRRIGIVTQDVQLFEASVRDNLTLFDSAVPDARILDALDGLGLRPWYDALPHGLDTELAAGDGGLSAGEAQLVAFARVFLRDPSLVILDEASSRLDPATERLIERAVDRLLAGRTGIVIAHRLATVQRVDDILVLESGRIREHGPRAALARDPDSRFSEFLRSGMEQVPA